ncbi:hypothetical protein [Sulfitobacter faviae]|uniref:hypothetical protein n=1 Tax=Sulfitobacter faviae TaxID=1775881 RepID=UPI0024576B2E|nr:hypothetical protein [Sulfitobacter faviae]MDH4538943.1 hypothetical protein [Sulfitobacter faviae]
MDLKKGEAPRFTLQSDLAGLGVSVPQLSWSKAPGTEGKLRLAGRLGETPNIDAFQLNAPGLRVAGSIHLAPAAHWTGCGSTGCGGATGWISRCN